MSCFNSVDSSRYSSQPDRNIEIDTKRNVESFLNACHQGDLETLRQTLSSIGFDQNGKPTLNENSHGNIIQQGCDIAAGHNQAPILDYLFEHHGAELTPHIYYHTTWKPRVAIFEVLLKHGMDPNMKFVERETVLLSVMHNEEIVRLLLAHGADPSIAPPYSSQYDLRTPWPKKPLNCAARKSTELFDLLIAHGAKLEESLPLHGAVWGDADDGGERIPMMKHILELGVDINQLDEVRSMRARGTALHHAVILKRTKTVEFLLDNGADPRVESGCCAYALHKATALQLAEGSTPEISRMIRDHARP